MGSGTETKVFELCRSRRGAYGCFDRVAGIGGRGQASSGTNNSRSRRLRWCRQLRNPNRESARRAHHRADVAVDYTKAKFEDVAKDVDAVLDPIGKETLTRSYGVVKKGGILMCLVALPDRAELQKREIHGAAISVHPDAADLTEIAHLIDAGKIKPIVTQVLPLSEAITAQKQAATHHTRGKVVVRIAAEPKG